MNYREAVVAAAAALKGGNEDNWELSRLTFENTNALGEKSGTSGKATLEQWSKDVRETAREKFSSGTAWNYRACWVRGLEMVQGDPTLVGTLSWADVYSEVRGGTVRERIAPYDLKAGLKSATPEVKAETAAALLSDPEVMEHAVGFGAPLSRALAEAVDTQRALREERVERIIERDPISQGLRSVSSLTELAGILARCRQAINERLPYIQGLPDPATDPTAQAVLLREEFLGLETAMASLRALLTTGRVSGDVDDFVGQVLREGEK